MSEAQTTGAPNIAAEGGVPIIGQTAPAQPTAQPTASPDVAPSDVATGDVATADSSPPQNPLARQTMYTFAAAEIDSAVDQQLTQLGKTTRINGFRSGHVPMRVMRQRWGRQCLNEVLTQKADERFADESKNMEEPPAAKPHFAAAVADTADEYRVECRYEVMPLIAAPDFGEQKIRRPQLQVGDKEVDEMIQRLRRDAGHYHEVMRAARADDSLQVDFEAYHGDTLAESGKDRRWILDSPMLNGELAKQLLGASAGESRTATITHSDNHPEESLRGVAVRLQITINAVAELHLPELNEEFFSRFGVSEGGEAKFRAKVGEQLKAEVGRRLRQSMHTQAMNALVGATPKFDLPRSLVQTEAVSIYQNMLREAKQNGMPEVSANAAPHIYNEAARRVALGLIIGKWQEREKQIIGEEDINAQLDEFAADREDAEAFKTQVRQNEQTMHALHLAAIEERVVRWVCERAQTTDETLTLSQLLDGDARG